MLIDNKIRHFVFEALFRIITYTTIKLNIAGRLPESSRNSVVNGQSQKDSKRKTKTPFLLNAEMLYLLLRICLS